MKLKEIQERKAALLKELENNETPVTEERMTEIETEIRNLEAEEIRITKQEELRSKLKGNEVQMPAAGPEENTEEQRAAQIKASGKVTIPASEVRSAILQERSLLIASDSLTAPTKVSTEIHDKMNAAQSIVDKVEVVDLTGCSSYEEAYVKTEIEARTRTDGSAATGSDPVFRVAKLQPYLVNVTSYISKNIERVTPTTYAEKVRGMALKALKKKIAGLIVNGQAGSFMGIKIAKNTKDETICGELTLNSNTIDAGLLRKIVFAYGGSDELGASAVLFLTKEDLAKFGEVRGTNEKKPVYEITPDAGNPNCGTIKDGGIIVPYSIHSGLTSLSTATQGKAAIPTMIYGDPKNFELGLFGPYTVEVSKDYKFAEGLLTIMGEAMVGGNVIVDGGFVVVTLAASGS